MLKHQLKLLLKKVKSGKISIEDALKELETLPFADLGFAKVDVHRELRKGFPEAVLCLGKTSDQIRKIVSELIKTNRNILATKANESAYQAIRQATSKAKYYKEARLVVIEQEKRTKTKELILVISGGTADIPIAEEAAITAEMMGNRVERLYDVGVAGIHRLLAHQAQLAQAKVIIVVAGMEGALPSFVAGLVSAPVIAVPTSIGYGASFGGLSALLGMLNSCATGIAVVNIDNGFGAGCLASLINQTKVKS